MVTYFLNWMGPINPQFIAKYGDGWRCGRIDIDDGMPYGREYSVGVMDAESWLLLGEYLRNLRTEEVWCYQRIIDTFEREYQHNIVWLVRED